MTCHGSDLKHHVAHNEYFTEVDEMVLSWVCHLAPLYKEK